MIKKAIVFNLPSWLVVLLKVSKRIFTYLTIVGIGGVVVESTYQFKPLATLIFVLMREGIAEFMMIYINQEISEDDK